MARLAFALRRGGIVDPEGDAAAIDRRPVVFGPVPDVVSEDEVEFVHRASLPEMDRLFGTISATTLIRTIPKTADARFAGDVVDRLVKIDGVAREASGV